MSTKFLPTTNLENENLENLKQETVNILETNINQLKGPQSFKMKSLSFLNTMHDDKPWFLLIGAKGSGKSTLVNDSEQTFLNYLANNNQDCKTWVTKDLVLFDLPGEFSSNDTTITSWQTILKLFQKNRKASAVDGIILTLNLHHLIHYPKTTKAKFNLHLQNILQLIKNVGINKIPVYVTITNTDTLVGFEEYFNDLGKEEMDAPWGITLSPLTSTSDLELCLITEFKKIHATLQKRLLWRLNSNAGSDSSAKIYEFPIQFNAAEKFIIENLKQIFTPAILQSFSLNNVFFVSNSQSGRETDCLASFTKKVISSNLIKPVKKHNLVARYFSNQLLQTIATSKSHPRNLTTSKTDTRKISKYTLGLFTILATIIIAGIVKSVWHDSNIIKSMNDNLVKAQVQLHKLSNDNHSPKHILALLHKLDVIDAEQEDLSVMNVFTPIMPSLSKTKENFQNLYSDTIKKIFFPFIQTELHKQLTMTIANNDLVRMYPLLKAYNMLSETDNYEQTHLHQHSISALRNNPYLETKDINSLSPHIKKVLVYPPSLPIDKNLINQAKIKLSKSPPAKLVYALFKSNSANNLMSQNIIHPDGLFK